MAGGTGATMRMSKNGERERERDRNKAAEECRVKSVGQQSQHEIRGQELRQDYSLSSVGTTSTQP